VLDSLDFSQTILLGRKLMIYELFIIFLQIAEDFFVLWFFNFADWGAIAGELILTEILNWPSEIFPGGSRDLVADTWLIFLAAFE